MTQERTPAKDPEQKDRTQQGVKDRDQANSNDSPTDKKLSTNGVAAGASPDQGHRTGAAPRGGDESNGKPHGKDESESPGDKPRGNEKHPAQTKR